MENWFLKNNIRYPLNFNYSSITPTEKNIDLANSLKRCYLGKTSELISLYQYTNESIMYSNSNKLISEILFLLSETTLKHVYILGLLISNLSNFDMLLNSNKNLFSQSNCFPVSTEEALIYNITYENKLINQYIDVKKEISNKEIIKIINNIILEKELHLIILKELNREFFSTK